MINRAILESNVMNKFKNLTLHSVVNSCFLNGLLLNKEDMNKSDYKNLSKYSLSVLESVGGFVVAKESLNNLTDIKQKALLNTILSTCEEAALEATKRVVKETNMKDPDNKLNEIVDKASFTEEEYTKFKSKVNNIDLDEISGIINEKTLNVIKNEKELQEKDEEIKAQLQDALKDSKSFPDVSVESYLGIVLKSNDVRTPVSFFSKLMEVSYENLLHCVESDKELNMDAIRKITFEGTLKTFKRDKTPVECFESLLNVNSTPIEPNDETKEKMMNKSMICGIVIYTILETLKTLNIYSPSVKEIESFIRNTPNCNDIIAKDKEDFINYFNTNINNIKTFCSKNVPAQELANTRNKLLEMKDKISIDSFNDTGFLNAKEELIVSVDSLVDSITAKLNKLESGLGNKDVSFFDKKAMESDIAGLNRINSLYGSNVNVSDIYLAFNPANESLECVDIICKNSNGAVVNQSFIPFRFNANNNESYIKESFKNSTLNNTKKNVHIMYNNGTGKTYQIN
jgi:hypothetical protein